MSEIWTALAAAGPLACGWAAHGVWLRRHLAAARRDPLTGVATREEFEHKAARILARHAAAVVVIDLDGFKALNDTFGHAAGDVALRATAASLKDALERSPGSVVARLGGDEFAAVVPEPVALAWLLGGLHGEITAPFAHQGQHLAVGASVGAVATVPGAGLSWALRRADEAMYAAKRTGGGWHIADAAASSVATVNGRRAGRPGTAGKGAA
ncbi:GGDEF domain-containing protein [Streptomyces sp. KL2]|uniref:GGDEF domain-containing protein n=1 Tax=Streptomyces sp. KL2 TaxID=3050126 RepID=UPI00397820FD